MWAVSDFFEFFAGQGLLDAPVHAQCGKGFGSLGQRLGGGLDRSGVGARQGLGQIGDQGFDGRELGGLQQVGVGTKCAAGGGDHALGVHPGFDQRARLHVLLSGGKTVLEHGGDLLVRQPVGGLDVNLRLDTAALLFGTDRQQAVGIHREAHADARGTRGHGRNATQREPGQAAAVGHQVALALHHVQRQRGLAVLVSGEILRQRGRDGAVARHDALDQPAHGFDAERERDHVEQQQIAIAAVARERIGLDGRAQRHHLVRIQIGQRRLAEELAHRAADHRHAGGTAHHHHALDVFFGDAGVAQDLAHRRHGAHGERGGAGFKLGQGDGLCQRASADLHAELHLILAGERLLAVARLRVQRGAFGRREVLRGHPLLRQHPGSQRLVVVVAAQRRVAAGGHHLEHAARQAQDGDVEGATAQIVDGVDAFGAVVQAVRDRRGGGLVDEAQHVDAGELSRVLGGLALCVIEVGRHGDDRAKELVVKTVFGPETQGGQDLGTHLHRRLAARHGLDHRHAVVFDHGIGQLVHIGHLGKRAAHQALDRTDGVGRVLHLGRERLEADLTARPALLRIEVTHHAGQDHAAVRRGQAFGDAMAHRGHQRVRGAQVNADRHPSLV
ncbi:NAD-specific glutamate dehydrogenase, partial [Hydrogenophaga taeniospiralis CCUG 15921]|nr:NAD-specific glutamate dehydrogenase [Hydrogenophaga taeniospiralis CCUG 15921]